MGALGLIFLLAVLIEGIVEYFFEPVPAKHKRYVAALFGVGVCVLYAADLIALFGYTAPIPFVGSVLTGLIVGRGSNYVNDFISWFKVVQAPATTVDHVEADAQTIASLERDIQQRRPRT